MMQVADTIQSPLRIDEDGVIRVGATRVPIDTVIGAFQDGATPETIVAQYPALTLVQVYGTITYYLEHQLELDRYLAEREAEAERNRQKIEDTPDRDEFHRRLLSRWAAMHRQT